MKDGIAVASIDDDFGAVGGHAVEGPGIRKCFLDRYVMEFMDVDFGECMNELFPLFAFIRRTVPPKM